MLPTRITLKGVLSGQLIGIPSSSVSWQSQWCAISHQNPEAS
jgi:hypothetical protein